MKAPHSGRLQVSLVSNLIENRRHLASVGDHTLCNKYKCAQFFTLTYRRPSVVHQSDPYKVKVDYLNSQVENHFYPLNHSVGGAVEQHWIIRPAAS